MYGPEPTLPDIPRQEWRARIDEAQRRLADARIDLLVLWNGHNIRYFSGFTSIHWNMTSVQPLVLLIPASGEPVAVGVEFFRSTIEAQTWVRDIRCQHGVDEHSETSVRQFPVEVAHEIAEMGFAHARIALEMGPTGYMSIPRPLNDILGFMKALPQATFVDGDAVIWGCRQVKSPLEIDRLERAAEIHGTAMRAVAEQYRPGMTEADVGLLYTRTAYDTGADAVLPGNIMCGAAKEGVADTGHHFTSITIGRDDYLELDLPVSYLGYWADMARVLNAGPITPEFARISEQTRRAFEAVVNAARPGLTVRQLQRVFHEAGGCDTPHEMAGHGIGLDIHEPPMVTSDSQAVLRAGMTFEIEPFLDRGRRADGGLGLFHYENLLIITETGARAVYTLDPAVIQVAYPIP